MTDARHAAGDPDRLSYPALVEGAGRALCPLRLLRGIFVDPLLLWTDEHFTEPIVRVRTPIGSRLIVSDPTAIRHVLVDNAANYVRDGLQQRIVLRTTGRSLFAAEGEDWRVQRRAFAPSFAPKALQQYWPSIDAAGQAAIAARRAALDQPFDLQQAMATMTVDSILRALFAGRTAEPPAHIAADVRQFAEVMAGVRIADLLQLPRWWPNLGERRSRALVSRVGRRAEAILGAAPASEGDVVSSLLQAEVAGMERGLDENIVTDNISMLLGAGSETVALALTWTIVLLADAPGYCDRIEDEISTVTSGGALTAGAIPKLHWTRAAIEEAMRLYPPAPMIGRLAVADDVIAGERLARGTAIIIAPWVIHRHRRLWSDPDTFRPERFLPGARASIDRFAYLPFGAGPRVCIGAGFAMLEAVALLALLLRAFRFHRTDAAPVRPRQKLTLLPAAPIMMRTEVR